MNIKTEKRRVAVFLAITAGVLILVNSAVIRPIKSIVDSNILYKNTVIADLLYWMTDGTLILEHLILFVTSAAIIYSICKYGVKESRPIFFVSLGVPVLSYIINILATFAVVGTAAFEDILFSLLIGLAYIFFDVLTYFVVGLVAYLVSKKAMENNSDGKKIERGERYYESLKIKKVISFKNPLQAAAVFAVVLGLAENILNKGIYEVTYYIQYNAFDGEILVWIADIAIALALTALGYLVINLVFMNFEKKEQVKE